MTDGYLKRLIGGGRALPQDWGEQGGVVPISDFIRLPGMQILI